MKNKILLAGSIIVLTFGLISCGSTTDIEPLNNDNETVTESITETPDNTTNETEETTNQEETVESTDTVNSTDTAEPQKDDSSSGESSDNTEVTQDDFFLSMVEEYGLEIYKMRPAYETKGDNPEYEVNVLIGNNLETVTAGCNVIVERIIQQDVFSEETSLNIEYHNWLDVTDDQMKMGIKDIRDTIAFDRYTGKVFLIFGSDKVKSEEVLNINGEDVTVTVEWSDSYNSTSGDYPCQNIKLYCPVKYNGLVFVNNIRSYDKYDEKELESLNEENILDVLKDVDISDLKFFTLTGK